MANKIDHGLVMILIRQGWTVKEIAEEIHCTERQVAKRIDCDTIMDLIRLGWTVGAVAKGLDCNEQTLRDIITDQKKGGKLDGEPAF